MSDRSCSTSGAAVLESRKVVKHYRQGPLEVEVLNGVDLCLGSGERLAIVGASGSGKSTLLNLLGGLDTADSGEILLKGHALSACNETQRARLRNRYLGFVYQFHHLLGEFTALENTAIPAMIGGIEKSSALQRAGEWLGRVGLGARLSHKPSELSGGERQRVAIARALVNQPVCVLMDEPTGNLDRGTAQSIQGILMDLSSDLETAFVVVTHDEQLASSMDRVLRLEDGKLQ